METAWQDIETLVRIGFERSPVVMVNEAHNGAWWCPRTRAVGLEALAAATAIGCTKFAMESLTAEIASAANHERRLTKIENGYLMQEDLRTLIDDAIRLGFWLVAYEAEDGRGAPDDHFERAKWRDLEQAKNLIDQWNGKEMLLVWVGNLHLAKETLMSPYGEYPQMATQFWERSGVEPFVIDQTLTVEWNFAGAKKRAIAEHIRTALEKRGGTAGFMREQTPVGFDVPTYADAFLLSTDNKLVLDWELATQYP